MLDYCIVVFQWYSLNDVKSGRVHLVLEWVPTVSEPSRLDQVRIISKLIDVLVTSDTDSLTGLFLRVYVWSGDAVPLQAVLPEQSCSLCGPAVCVCG